MEVNIWKFYLNDGNHEAFKEFNSEKWPNFFNQSPHYKGTDIGFHPVINNIIYTKDYWSSQEDFNSFIVENKKEYDALKLEHSKLYDSCEHVGFLDAI